MERREAYQGVALEKQPRAGFISQGKPPCIGFLAVLLRTYVRDILVGYCAFI